MKFTLHKNLTVVGMCGLAVRFEKGVPTYVPKELYNDVLAKGAVSETELEDDTPEGKKPVVDPEERKVIIFKAFEEIVVGGRREDFTGNGSPHNRVVSEKAGFAVDAKERDKLWTEFRQSQGGDS